jgi:hypothetical protein
MDTRGYDVMWTNPSERTTREALLMEVSWLGRSLADHHFLQDNFLDSPDLS